MPSLSACATTADHRTLRVVVTNDDGVAAPGIDILVRTLDQLPDVEVRVFAPASDRSGTGESRSGHVLFGTVSKTRSGHPAVALAGFPSDTVLYADRAGVLANADVVVSGVNWGENLGTVIEHSGTIGAARTAARLGLPRSPSARAREIPLTSRRVPRSRRSGSRTIAPSCWTAAPRRS